MHHVGDQRVAQPTAELIAADSPGVAATVVCSGDYPAGVARTELTDHPGVVVKKIAHRLAGLLRVREGVRDGNRLQKPTEVIMHQLVEAVPLKIRADERHSGRLV